MSVETDPVTCAVVACPNNYPTEDSQQNRVDLTYHRFPKDAAMRAAWLKICLRPKNWDKVDFSYVCSDHFDPTDFNYPDPGSHEVYLSQDAIPSTRTKFAIKTEPIDVEEEFKGLNNEDDFEIVMGTDDQDSTDILDPEDSQDFDQNDSIYLGDLGPRHKCPNCSREFKTESRLSRHEIFCSLREKRKKGGPRANSGTACFYKDCPAKFYHRNKMLKHMELAHQCFVDEKQKLKFANMEEFWTWKENEEERTYSYFSKRTGNHKNTATYHCQRDGPSRASQSKADNPRVLKRQLTKGNIKENIVCLAHIKTTLNVDGTVSAIYFPSHNHPLSAMDYLHHPLSRATQMFIKEKLELGYTSRQIADELLARQNASANHGDSPSNMTKNQFLHMVNKLDRIRGFLDRERKRMREEASGIFPPRTRRSRKVILEEQFQKSRQYQAEVQEGKKYLRDVMEFVNDDDTVVSDDQMDLDQNYSELYQENGEEGETVVGDYTAEVNEVGGILGAEEFLKSLEGATGVLCEQEDVVQELILDESGRASSNSTDYRVLYREAVAANKKLSDSVGNLKKRLDKKEKQVNLLINALKKSLSEDHADLNTLKETVSDGDYEIIVV